MGFLDNFFRSQKKDDDLPPGKKTHYQGDLTKTNIIQQLFKTPKEARDAVWQQKFLANVADAAFRAAQPQVIKGPDGFPYFILFIPEAFQNFQAYTIRHMKDDFLLDSGYGIVVNPQGNAADWVFSYGDIVNFHITGEFYSPSQVPLQRQETLLADEKMMAGAPSEKFLPKQARAIIRDFLKSMGIAQPKVMLVSRNINGKPVQELSFNVTQGDFPTQRHYTFTMEHLAWYLPRHYSVLTFDGYNEFQKNYVDL